MQIPEILRGKQVKAYVFFCACGMSNLEYAESSTPVIAANAAYWCRRRGWKRRKIIGWQCPNCK